MHFYGYVQQLNGYEVHKQMFESQHINVRCMIFYPNTFHQWGEVLADIGGKYVFQAGVMPEWVPISPNIFFLKKCYPNT